MTQKAFSPGDLVAFPIGGPGEVGVVLRPLDGGLFLVRGDCGTEWEASPKDLKHVEEDGFAINEKPPPIPPERHRMKRDRLPMRLLIGMRDALRMVDAGDVHDMNGESSLEKARAFVDACDALAWVETEIRRRKWNAAPDCPDCGARCEGQRGAGYICECENGCGHMH